MAKEKLPECAVILAGGRGTRFWPRSRRRAPKQLINIIGTGSMLQQTVARLAPVLRLAQLWAVTNDDLVADVRKQMHGVPRKQILSEPVGRNTAAAIALAAIHLRHIHGDALMAVLPADHFISQPAKYRRLVRAALDVAATAGQIAVLGIHPTRPETGYGYIECVKRGATGKGGYPVRRFTEKPALEVAKKYIATRRYFWNAGMFFWRVTTFLERLRWYLPQTHTALEELAATIGTPRYARTLRKIYPRLKNISVDYAILEPATKQTGEHGVHVIAAKCGWSDIGSWETVYELMSHGKSRGEKSGVNVAPGAHFALDASGNFLWSPRKFIAAVGICNLAVVDTEDALLICPRERAQDAGKVVKWLEAHKRDDLL
jgi:mannose-1-phosphate guanylyltransferase